MRERAPQPKARSASECSAPPHAENLKLTTKHIVPSQSVRFWGCGGWEASPTRAVTHHARASTAAEGEERKRVFRTAPRRKPKTHDEAHRSVAKCPLLGVWGMGGIPHTSRDAPCASEHRSRRRG